MENTNLVKQAEDLVAKMNHKELQGFVNNILAESDLDAVRIMKKFLQKRSGEKEVMLNREISNIFVMIGIPPHIKGYQYLRYAIRLCTEDPTIISSITKRLYPDVAKQFTTTPSKVERAIRHAIEVCWNRGRIDNINNLFGSRVFTRNERPTNGEFIALLADKLLLDGTSD